MIPNLRRLLILLLIIALPWPGAAMMAAGWATPGIQEMESQPCHDLGNHSAAAAESVTHSLPHPESCAAGHAGKCCVSCQAYSLPGTLPTPPRLSFTPYPAAAERWSGFIPDLLHRPPR